MKVKLVTYTPEPEKLVATAARLCYSNKADIETIASGFTEEEIAKFIKMLLEQNHMSPFEHVAFTFGIEGISRTVSHELVRHRIGIAISQRSQRYCSEGECDFVGPDEYGENVECRVVLADKVFKHACEKSKEAYDYLCELGVDKQFARYVLPNATATRMIVTMNARELMHFFNMRCCAKAQPEMQKLAKAMLALVKPVAPVMFAHAGPKCVSHGFCPEGKRSCGAAPTIEELLDSRKH